MIKVTAFLYIVAKCKQNIHCYFVDCFRKSRANNPEGLKMILAIMEIIL